MESVVQVLRKLWSDGNSENSKFQSKITMCGRKNQHLEESFHLQDANLKPMYVLCVGFLAIAPRV